MLDKSYDTCVCSLQLNDQTPEMSALFESWNICIHADKLKLFDKASRHTVLVWINKSKPNAYLEATEEIYWKKKN